MDDGSRRIALMSIRPVYWSRIISGEKRYELRRTSILLQRGDLVVVYASAPTKAIVGTFVVGSVERVPKRDAWERLQAELGVSRSTYVEYFSGANLATAISVQQPAALRPVPLPELRVVFPSFRPPQSFQYWSAEELSRLERHGRTMSRVS